MAQPPDPRRGHTQPAVEEVDGFLQQLDDGFDGEMPLSRAEVHLARLKQGLLLYVDAKYLHNVKLVTLEPQLTVLTLSAPLRSNAPAGPMAPGKEDAALVTTTQSSQPAQQVPHVSCPTSWFLAPLTRICSVQTHKSPPWVV